MAESDRELVRLSDSDFDVARGDVDPRGWKLFSRDGRKIGKVDELIGDTATRKVRYLDVDLDEKELGLERDRHAMIPVGYIRLDDSKRRVVLEGIGPSEVANLPATVSDIGPEFQAHTHGPLGSPVAEEIGEGEEFRLTRSEEELEIGKREVVKGDVVIRKEVESEHVTRPVTRMHEEVDIERRPVEGMRGSEAEFQEEEIRIPLHEEELEVRKRPQVKEELVVKKRPVVEHEEIDAELRRERIELEREGNIEEEGRPERGLDQNE